MTPSETRGMAKPDDVDPTLRGGRICPSVDPTLRGGKLIPPRSVGSTLEEYMDPIRYSLTTQPGLSARSQLQIDAFNLSSLEEMIENKSSASPHYKR